MVGLGSRTDWRLGKRQKVAKRTDLFVHSGEWSGASRNGPLVMGVIAAILIMVGLGALNMTFLGDPCPTPKPGTNPSSTGMPWSRVPACSGQATKECSAPTPMTFYEKLTTHENQSHPKPEYQAQSPTLAVPSKTPLNLPDSDDRPEAPLSGPPAGAPKVMGSKITPQPQPLLVSRSEKKAKSVVSYTVQVGAYTEPNVASQWAERWRRKGYKATLRPVARADGSILYRLQLGGFESAQAANELVQRLSKEGVTSMRRRVSK
jgi:cell division septation protein DedD